MTESTHPFAPTPANENIDPLLRADTGLDELYYWRGRLLNRDLNQLTLDQWRKHRKSREKLDGAIRE
jgi:hypothetical protein